MKHLIKKQELLLAVDPGLEAFGVQHAASRYYRDILLPLIEKVFDELSVEEEVIRIDRLVIDIGPIPEKSLRNNTPEMELYTSIKKELMRVLQGQQPDADVLRAPLRVNILAQWWYYMEKGRLPWNVEGITAEWYRHVLEILAVDFSSITRLRQVLTKDEVFLKRVVYQHPDEFLERLTGILTGARQPLLSEQIEGLCFLIAVVEREYRQSISVLPAPGGRSGNKKNTDLIESLQRWYKRQAALLSLSRADQKAVIWGRLVSEAALRPEALQAGNSGRLLTNYLSEDAHLLRWVKEQGAGAMDWINMEGLTGNLPATAVDKAIEKGATAPNSMKQPAKKNEKRNEDEDVTAELNQQKDVADHFLRSPIGDDTGEERPDMEDLANKASTTTDSTDPQEEGLYGRHAGLVLLHPFLSTLFSRLHLWDGGGFTSLAARQQAVLLLHYLATGQKEGLEYELVFPKLLCGCRLETPLPLSVDMSEKAYEEADALLQHVLLRWDKLKNTSADGLREGFLQRTGKLFSRNGRLVILMEISAIDVLLDFLPWNLGIVKLPWLKDLLYVEWR